MPRPSPRTQGVTASGETFQKFGVQQLHFAVGTPPKLGTPYQGVTQVNTGQNWKAITTAPVQAVKWLTGLQTGTAFSQQFQSGRTGSLPLGATYIPPPSTATPNGEQTTQPDEKCHLDDDKPFCGFTELIGGEKCECPNWFTGEVTPPAQEKIITETAPTCTTCDSDKCMECNAWDIPCELAHMAGGTCTPPPKTPPLVEQGWWNKYQYWVYGILAVVGIGILLWLLRPLFELLGVFKRGSP